MLLLTKDTVDDSATVRVVTLVTLIYLPASFVSVGYQSGITQRLLLMAIVTTGDESLCISGHK